MQFIPLGLADRGGKNIGVKAGITGHRSDCAIAGIDRDYSTQTLPEGSFGNLLEVEIEGQRQSLANAGGLLTQHPNDFTAHIHLNLLSAPLPPQAVFVGFFDTDPANDIA